MVVKITLLPLLFIYYICIYKRCPAEFYYFDTCGVNEDTFILFSFLVTHQGND